MQIYISGLMKEQQTQEQVQPNWTLAPKTSLCRFFLRGNCPNPTPQCLFAHGIQQLKFVPYNEDLEKEMKPIYYDFRAKHAINQLDIVLSQQNKNYVNLYEFQCWVAKSEPEKYYTLQQINGDRNLKIQIRRKFHQHQFSLFLQLIQKSYGSPEEKQEDFRFNHEELELEYYRVGFNKLMTRIKISYLIDFLVLDYKGGHFKFTSIFPPYRSKTATFYLRMADEGTVIEHYRKVYEETKKKFEEQKIALREEDIRQAMFRQQRAWWCIPPLSEVLHIKHCTLKQFLINGILKLSQNGESSQEGHEWITDESIQIAKIHEIIQIEIQKKEYCLSSQITALSPKFNRNLIEKCVNNQRKECSGQPGSKCEQSRLILIKCPNIKTEVITKEFYLKAEAKYDRQFGITLDILIEDIIEMAISKLLKLEVKSQKEMMKESDDGLNKQVLKGLVKEIEDKCPDSLSNYKLIEIATADQLIKHSQQMLTNSTILGVDLEGSLSDCQNGYLSLIQINHYSLKIIYLIDYLTISKGSTAEELQDCKASLTRIFNDQDIVKIIHDSRNDAECLYYLLGKDRKEEGEVVKFTNIFDTAACEQVIRQVQNPGEFKSATPSLNDVLQKYGQAPNHLKHKYHTIWAEGKGDPSMERPMAEEFKQYCAMDVVGLPKVYTAMSKLVNPYFLVLISQFHADWSQNRQKKQPLNLSPLQPPSSQMQTNQK